MAHALTTLAAAYSETGNFAAAVEWQEKALGLVADKSPEQHEYRRLLDRYRAKKPYHRLGVLEEIGIQKTRYGVETGWIGCEPDSGASRTARIS